MLRELTDIRASEDLFASVWAGPGGGPMSRNLLVGEAAAGSYLCGAFDGGRLLGACLAFWGPPASRLMYSHIAGVAPESRGRDLGYAMKLDQRAWALAHGVDTVNWTYDPLVARNAHFNLHKLGGTPIAYHVDHYGPMHDALNGGDETDRLLVRWRLGSAETLRAIAGSSPTPRELARPEAVTVLEEGPDGRPVRTGSDGLRTRLVIPRDIERLRRADPSAAHEWRLAVRAELGKRLGSGAVVEDFDRTASAYLLRREPTS
jgi:predicted GNAT superfamily acetyltransferase